MNERLQELLLEAHKQTKGGIYGGHPSEWSEKFAQLIVRECAELAKHHVMNISTYADAEFVDEQIKQNFGVK